MTFTPDTQEAIWQNMETGAAVNFIAGPEGPTYTYSFAREMRSILMIRKSICGKSGRCFPRRQWLGSGTLEPGQRWGHPGRSPVPDLGRDLLRYRSARLSIRS